MPALVSYATIWKYPLTIGTGVETIDIPQAAHILSVQVLTDEKPYVYAYIPDTQTVKWPMRFHTYGTGREVNMPTGVAFVGTYQIPSQSLVFHVFCERVRV